MKTKKPILRPLGDVTADMEPLLLEMADGHQLQVGEILNLIYGYLQIHTPGAFETYEADGSRPEFYYGSREGLYRENNKK